MFAFIQNVTCETDLKRDTIFVWVSMYGESVV